MRALALVTVLPPPRAPSPRPDPGWGSGVRRGSL